MEAKRVCVCEYFFTSYVCTNNTTKDHSSYIINEVSYVSRVGQTGSDGVLRLSDHRPLVNPAHPSRLVDDVLQGLRLLQLA